MTKEPIKLSIDNEVLEQAKKQIPNMSQFVENCLRAYLGDINSIFYTSKAQETLDTIKEAQTALYLLTERNNVDENIEKAAKDEINLAWRKLYAEYRDTRKMSPVNMDNAVKILGVSSEELRDIVEVLYAFRNETSIDVTEWDEVYNEYGYGDD